MKSQVQKWLEHPQLYGRFSVMNGLRAVTLFWVMFVHLPTLAVPDFLQSIHYHWRFGVDFFFAISGFLVMRSLLQCFDKGSKKYPDQKTGMNQSMIEYMIRRIARIFPPYYAILLVIGTLALVLKGGLYEHLKQTASVLPSFPLFFANYMIPYELKHLPHVLIILWSVSFQEQFYFMIAALFYFFRNNIKLALWLAGLTSIFFRLFLAFGPWSGLEKSGFYTFWLHLNFDAISWGCLAWLYYDELGKLWATRGRAYIATVLLILGDVFVISAPLYLRGDQWHVLISLLKAPLLALTVRAACELEISTSWFARFLRGKTLGKIGLASYEIYLIHVIMYGFVEKLNLTNGALFFALAYSISLTAGLIFYKYFGMPSQEITKNVLRAWWLLKPRTTRLNNVG